MSSNKIEAMMSDYYKVKAVTTTVIEKLPADWRCPDTFGDEDDWAAMGIDPVDEWTEMFDEWLKGKYGPYIFRVGDEIYGPATLRYGPENEELPELPEDGLYNEFHQSVVWDWVDKIIEHHELKKKLEAARNGTLPQNFDQWDLADELGWSVAHEAARHGHLPKGFDRWEIANKNEGWTVAHEAAANGTLPADFCRWEIADKDGWTVADAWCLYRALRLWRLR